MDLYAENILDHYRHPRNKRGIANPTSEHQEINHSCGDELIIYVRIADGKIADIGWSGTGCAISQAAMSMLSEELQGMPVDKAVKITAEDIHEMLGVPVGPRRFKCALLCLHTFINTVRKADRKTPQGWLETVEIA